MPCHFHACCVSWNVMGPNRSTAVDLKTGASPILRMGRGAIFCISLSLRSSQFTIPLHPLRQFASFDNPDLCLTPHHHGISPSMVYFVLFLEVQQRERVEGERTLHHRQLSGISWPFLPQPSACTGGNRPFSLTISSVPKPGVPSMVMFLWASSKR